VTGLRDRGLDAEHGVLFVLDGGKALGAAVRAVFGAKALIQRCGSTEAVKNQVVGVSRLAVAAVRSSVAVR